MAEYISGSINFQGLGSGTDFGAIIEQLKKIESIPMQRMEIWKLDWQARFDAFEAVLQSMRDAKSALSLINSRNKFVTKLTSSSKPEIAVISATGNAMDGNHSIEVTQLASNAIWSCGTNFETRNSSISTQNTEFTYTYKGQTRTLQIAANTGLESFVNMINNDPQNKGIRASIVQSGSGYRLQIQGKDSGADATLSIVPAEGLTFVGDSAWRSSQTYAGSDTIWGAGVGAGEFRYTIGFGGSEHNIAITSATTVDDLINAINSASGQDTAKLDDSGRLVITGASSVRGPATKDTIGVPYWTSSKYYDAAEALVAPDGATAPFSFTIGSDDFTVDVLPGASAADLVNAVNGAYPGEADVASLVRNADGKYAIQIAGASSVNGAGINGASSQAANGLNITPVSWTSLDSFASASDIAVQSGPQNFVFSVNGTTHSANLGPNSTAQDVLDAINAAAGSAVAELVADPRDGARQVLRLNGASVSRSAGLEGANAVTVAAAGVSGSGGMSGGFTFDGWTVRDPQNAKFMLDNWPDELESTSNNISGVLDGVTITVFDLGKAQLSVATDTESVGRNIQIFLDAINSVITTIRELSKVDESGAGYNFSVTNKDDNKAANKQLGSVLTGNYGVQLLTSRMKSLAAGMPPGFQKILGDDLLSGDLIASLSQIGIKTVSDKDDPNYGLLVIAPTAATQGMQDMDQKAFDEALVNKLDALIDFFACDDEGSSSSADFRYASHIKGGTKAGTYAVSYTVTYNAGVPVIDVSIDGRPASRDSSMDGYWFTSTSGPSAGLAIQIDNLNAGEHSGTVSIKQGKIREMEDFFSAETRSYDSDNHTGGALEILKGNYAKIMTEIDKKIEREQARLISWERRQKLAFSRLDALLAQYSANQQRLESEIGKLGPGIQ